MIGIVKLWMPKIGWHVEFVIVENVNPGRIHHKMNLYLWLRLGYAEVTLSEHLVNIMRNRWTFRIIPVDFLKTSKDIWFGLKVLDTKGCLAYWFDDCGEVWILVGSIIRWTSLVTTPLYTLWSRFDQHQRNITGEHHEKQVNILDHSSWSLVIFNWKLWMQKVGWYVEIAI